MQTLLKEVEQLLPNHELIKYGISKRKDIAFYQDGYIFTTDQSFVFTKELGLEYCILNFNSLDTNPVNLASKFLSLLVYYNISNNSKNALPDHLFSLNYPNNFLNFDYMRYERELLSKACNQKNNYERLNYLRMFINVRMLRCDLIDEKFIKEENKLETINGLSAYARYDYLSRKDKDNCKIFYKELLKNFSAKATNNFAFNNANIDSGLIQLIILSELGYRIDDLYNNGLSIIDYLKTKIKYIEEPISFFSNVPLIKNIKKYELSITETFTNFFTKEPTKFNGNFEIYSFDPENVIKEKHNLFHEKFVILKNLDNASLMHIDGPVVTKISEDSTNKVDCYYKLV